MTFISTSIIAIAPQFMMLIKPIRLQQEALKNRDDHFELSRKQENDRLKNHDDQNCAPVEYRPPINQKNTIYIYPGHKLHY